MGEANITRQSRTKTHKPLLGRSVLLQACRDGKWHVVTSEDIHSDHRIPGNGLENNEYIDPNKVITGLAILAGLIALGFYYSPELALLYQTRIEPIMNTAYTDITRLINQWSQISAQTSDGLGKLGHAAECLFQQQGFNPACN